MSGCVVGGYMDKWLAQWMVEEWVERMDKEMNERSAFLKGLFTKSP